MAHYCSLHNHSEYTQLRQLLDSTIKIPDLLNRAIELGFSGCALTDHGLISGHVAMLEAYDKIKEEHPDFKIIFGNEIYLYDEKDYKVATKYPHCIILALDRIGYDYLSQLTSMAWERSFHSKGVTRTPSFYSDFDKVVGQDKGHLVCMSACLGGTFATSILEHDSDKMNGFVQWGIETFGKDCFFLEMQDADSADQIIVNQYIVKIAEFYGIDYVITNDSHYLRKEDSKVHSAFLNSRESSDRETESFYRYCYLKSPEESTEILKYLSKEVIDKGFNNSEKIYDKVQVFDIRQDVIVPERKLPEYQVSHLLKEWYDKYPNIKYYAYSEYSQDTFLLYSIEEGIKEKNFKVDEEIAARIDIELETLKYVSEELHQRMSAYLNLVREIVDLCWEVTFVGVSRGSAMSFLINYLIGITQVNPIPFSVPYWRFMSHASAGSLPDVDLDFNGERSDAIMEILRKHYGQDGVLNAMTYKRESLKSAILTACRGLEISSDEAQALSAMVPISRGHVYSLQECEEGDEEKGYAPEPALIRALQNYPNLYETTKKIEGLISGSGIHASAVYIFNDGYLKQNSLMRAPNGTKVTCMDYRASDARGALKFDCLYTDLQTKLMKCVELMLDAGVMKWQGSLRATYNKYLHPDAINLTDPEIYKMMYENRLLSCFQFDSTQGRICISRTKPTNIKELGAANAVMRLMAEGGGESPLDRYVRFRNDINEWYKEMDEWGLTKEEQEVLKKYLLHKFGNSVEQEDMIELVMCPDISNFTLKEATKLRKAVSKKKLADVEKMKKRFFEAADD